MKTPTVSPHELKAFLLKPSGFASSSDDPLAIRASALMEIVANKNLKPFVNKNDLIGVWSDLLFEVAASADLNKNNLFIRQRFIKTLFKKGESNV